MLRVGLRIMNIQRKKLNNGTLLENLLKTLILAIGNMEIQFLHIKLEQVLLT